MHILSTHKSPSKLFLCVLSLSRLRAVCAKALFGFKSLAFSGALIYVSSIDKLPEREKRTKCECPFPSLAELLLPTLALSLNTFHLEIAMAHFASAQNKSLSPAEESSVRALSKCLPGAKRAKERGVFKRRVQKLIS
jgi:hypothetical protein